MTIRTHVHIIWADEMVLAVVVPHLRSRRADENIVLRAESALQRFIFFLWCARCWRVVRSRLCIRSLRFSWWTGVWIGGGFLGILALLGGDGGAGRVTRCQDFFFFFKQEGIEISEEENTKRKRLPPISWLKNLFEKSKNEKHLNCGL